MSETTTSAPLLPCPFCGASARGYEIEPHQHSAALLALVPNMPKEHQGSYVIEGDCQCGSGLIGDNQAEVTARWNARAPHAVAAQAAPAAVAVPPLTPDEARWAAKDARQKNGPSDPTQPSEYVMAGALALAAKLAATPEHPATEDSSAGDLAEAPASRLTMEQAEAIAFCSTNEPTSLLRYWFRKGYKAAADQAEVRAEPVMIYHGRCTIDCGEHGHHDVEMLKMIPAGAKLYTAPQAQPADALDDTKLLNFLRDECCDLRCDSYPTGGDDSEVYWKVIEHHMAKPHEREIGCSYSNEPRQAIRAAMAAAQEGGNAAKEA